MRVFACMASTLDGKIGPAGVEQFVSISSPHDLQHLERLRDQADGILFGAGTYRAWPRVHAGRNKSHKPHHFIMSRSLKLNTDTPLFQDPDTLVTIFTSTSKPSTDRFPERVSVVVCPEGPGQVASIMAHVRGLGVTSLLVEGGGKILSRFIEAQILQELYLTLVPTLMGQPNAPELLGGLELSKTHQFQIISNKQVGNELYLHLKLDYSS